MGKSFNGQGRDSYKVLTIVRFYLCPLLPIWWNGNTHLPQEQAPQGMRVRLPLSAQSNIKFEK